MTGAELIAHAHPLGLALLAERGDMVPQVMAVDGAGQVVMRTMLMGRATAGDLARRALLEPGVAGLVYLGLADREGRRALFLEAVSRTEPEFHYQLFQEILVVEGHVGFEAPDGYRVPAGESHLGPVFPSRAG